MNFETYIAELLQDHDCVIIPEFGGFVANYASAKINSINHRFDPPFRKISFNKLLLHNDGLLASFIARKEEELYEESVMKLKDYVVYLKTELRDNQKVTFDRIGILFKNNDGTFRFEQVKDTSFFPEGFALESFYAKKQNIEKTIEDKPIEKPSQPKPIFQQEPKVIPIQAQSDQVQRVHSHQNSSRSYWPAAAGLAIPIIGYVGWLTLGTPLMSNLGQFNYSDLNPFTKHISSSYEPRQNPFNFSWSELEEVDTEGEFIELRSEHQSDKILVVQLTEKTDFRPIVAGNYHVIGGCFGVKENADHFVSAYREKGFNSSIIDQKSGLYRVSIASYSTKKDALDALAYHQKEIPNAWLFHK